MLAISTWNKGPFAIFSKAKVIKCLWNSVKYDLINKFPLTVKPRKPWTPEKFQERWLCTGQSQLSSGHESKPQILKLITVAVCSLVILCLIGLFLATQ